MTKLQSSLYKSWRSVMDNQTFRQELRDADCG